MPAIALTATPYASQADLESRYSERDLRLVTDPQAQSIDNARTSQALDDAQGEIDSHLGQRYLLPLQQLVANTVDPLVTPFVPALLPVPSVLKRIACDIAIYRLQTLRPADDVKDARHRYEDTLKTLRMMAKGELQIPGASLLPGVSTLGDEAALSAGSADFGTASISPFNRGAR
ncbi:MAG: DUF1320 family protein [Burkholderiaceae bacterium]|nr:DUF1320 family protein [Burkholderiaceae bacterium]